MTLDRGLVLCVITLIFWALYDTVMRFCVSVLDVQPTLFTCASQIGGALALLAIAGRGPLAMETLKAPHTWTHGLLNLLTTSFFVIGVSYVTATEGTFLGRMDIFLGLVLPWLILKRKPSGVDWAGGVIILLGIGIITYNLDPAIRLQTFLAFILNAFFATLRTIEVENHPTSIKAQNNIRNRCRVSGLVLLVVGFFSVGFLLILYFLTAFIMPSLHDISFVEKFIPPLDAFGHEKTYIAGLITGAVMLAPSMFFYMYATMIAKTEKFLMMGCFLPYLTYAVEWVCSRYGLLDISTVTLSDLAAGGLIIFGSLFMVTTRQKADKS